MDEVLASERRARLMAAVSTLPDRERQVLVCRYFLDLSEAETAQDATLSVVVKYVIRATQQPQQNTFVRSAP